MLPWRDKRMNEQTRKDRATQPLDHGRLRWAKNVSSFSVYIYRPIVGRVRVWIVAKPDCIKGARGAIDDVFIPFSFVTALITNNNSAQVSAKKIFCNKTDLNHFTKIMFMLPSSFHSSKGIVFSCVFQSLSIPETGVERWEKICCSFLLSVIPAVNWLKGLIRSHMICDIKKFKTSFNFCSKSNASQRLKKCELWEYFDT